MSKSTFCFVDESSITFFFVVVVSIACWKRLTCILVFMQVSRCRVDQVFPPPASPPLPAPAPVPATSPTGRGGKDSDDYDEIDEMVAGTGVERVIHSETDEIGMQ